MTFCQWLIINRNIEEAETSKVIENIQRDINIGLMNEVYIFCGSSMLKTYVQPLYCQRSLPRKAPWCSHNEFW